MTNRENRAARLSQNTAVPGSTAEFTLSDRVIPSVFSPQVNPNELAELGKFPIWGTIKAEPVATEIAEPSVGVDCNILPALRSVSDSIKALCAADRTRIIEQFSDVIQGGDICKTLVEPSIDEHGNFSARIYLEPSDRLRELAAVLESDDA